MRLKRLAAASSSRSRRRCWSVGCGGGGEGLGNARAERDDRRRAAAAPDYLKEVGCLDDFEVLASQPLDTTIPGARSGKIVLDQSDGDALYFQNSNGSRSTTSSPRSTCRGRITRSFRR